MKRNLICPAVILSIGFNIFPESILSAGEKIGGNQTLYVNDFGAVPDDGKDDAEAIRKAFRQAEKTGVREIKFSRGTYYIESIETYPGGHQYHSALFDVNDIIISGEVDEMGRPATHLLKHNPNHIGKSYPRGRPLFTIFRFEGCSNIKLENFTIDNTPKSTTSAEIIRKGDDFIEVRILEGMPFFEGMPVHCANAWDLKSEKLKQVPSLTYGSSPAFWKLLDARERTMRLEGIEFSQYLEIGDGLTWHVGAESTSQVYFKECFDVAVENLQFFNGDGFLLETNRCRNVYGKNVVCVPNQKNQLAVGPRDAWKMAYCDGEVLIEDSRFDGVRWDGQNVHSTFLVVDEIHDNSQFTAYKVSRISEPIKTQEIGISVVGSMTKYDSASFKVVSHDEEERRTFYRVIVDGDLTESIVEGALITLFGYTIDNYELRNVTMKSIAGTGSVIKNENVLISNCTYENIMYPAINIGTNSSGSWIEGTSARNVEIRDSRFIDCGWQKRLDVMGAIGIGHGWKHPHLGRLQDIRILNNYFEACIIGIEVEEARDVLIKGNRFADVCRAINTNTLSSRNVREYNNTETKKEKY